MTNVTKKPSYSELDRMSSIDVADMFKQGLIDKPFYMGYLEHCKKKAFAVMRSKDVSDGKEYNYPTFEFGMAAYTHTLENDVSYKEALEFAAHHVGEDAEWLAEVRNKRFNHSKEVYERHKEHPVQKEMNKKGHFDKSTITNANSVAQMTKRLGIFKNVHQEVERLSDAVECLESDVTHLKMDNENLHHKIDTAYAHLGIEDLPKEKLAQRLKDSGWLIKDLSGYFSVDRKTVRRWLQKTS